MKFDLKKPCDQCPFRTDVRPYLRPARVRQILNDILYQDAHFLCHKTVDYSGDNGGTETEKTQHCAGALILLEHQERPNQMMRIAERLGLYDRFKLDMEASVYTNPKDMIQAAIRENARLTEK